MLLNTSVQKRAITSAKYGRSARCAQAVLSGVVFLMTGSHWRPLLRQLFANSSIVASREGGAIGSSRASAGKLSHQTVAEALHIELALMATTVGGFGQLPAHYSPAHLRPRSHVLGCCGRLRPLRSLRRRRQRDERKYQHSGSHGTSAPFGGVRSKPATEEVPGRKGMTPGLQFGGRVFRRQPN
jgi:hypothetical protein